MTQVTTVKMLIYTDAVNNNNKFYELSLHENGDVIARWGRVGTEGTITPYKGEGASKYKSLLNSKLKKGYTEASVLLDSSDVVTTSKEELKKTAKKEIIEQGKFTKKQQSMLEALIEKLTELNRHEIHLASSGSITVDSSGLIKTALGLVTLETITEAKKLLHKLDKLVASSNKNEEYVDSLNSYLKLIPQKVGSKRGWHLSFFSDTTTFNKQYGLLDQLSTSLSMFETKKEEQQAASLGTTDSQEEAFSTKLTLVTDKKTIAEITRKYVASLNSGHVASKLKLKNVYEISNEKWASKYALKAAKIGNLHQLWHGTRAYNVLSIFKNGLIVPKSGGSFTITGRMFGDGIYFSDQSSKSLNYSYGYWDGGPRDTTCFMFLADVAMGKSFTPSSSRRTVPAGYHSMFAKANESGVKNNEMIVYETDQVLLRYLCEFEE